MIRKFWTLGGWYQRTPDLTQRRLRILAALALVLLFAGANPSVMAQAAPASASAQFVMVAMPSADYICVNESMTFSVYVYRVFGSQTDAGFHQERLSGVAVDATVVDKSIGTITPDRQMTGFNNYDAEGAQFTFQAGKKPGTTKIIFEGLINVFWADVLTLEQADQIYVDAPVQVEVRKCSYKAELIFNGYFPGILSWTGTGDETRLNADSDTHFSGTSDFLTAEQMLIELPCGSLTGTISPTTVDYSADLVGDMLNFTFTIQDTKHTVTESCRGFTGSADTGIRSASVTFPSQGGVITHSQPYAVFTIIVERVIDEAAARQWRPDQRGISWPFGDSLALYP